MQAPRDNRYTLEDLLRVMRRLRDPRGGCPWDLQQDFHTIVPSTLEECYELAEAIESGEFDHVAEELGDVLFQVVFYAQLGSERGLFDFHGVVSTLVEKLLRRHPHVFAGGDLEADGAAETSLDAVRESWERIKQAERRDRDRPGVLADVPVALPALPRAQKLQKRAASVGFDWHESAAVFDKLEEELDELRGAMAAGSAGEVEQEMGDLLFSCVNLARHLGLDAEASLRAASRKFERRFNDMERRARSDGVGLEELDAGELDEYWRRSKRAERDL